MIDNAILSQMKLLFDGVMVKNHGKWCLILVNLDNKGCKMSYVVKKFTESQKKVLMMLCNRDVADYYNVLAVGGNGSTLKRLVGMGLISSCDTSVSYKEWQITDAGRFAKENDFDPKLIMKSAYLCLLDNITAGVEFPDAIYRVSEKYAVDAVKLQKMYDKDFCR